MGIASTPAAQYLRVTNTQTPTQAPVLAAFLVKHTAAIVAQLARLQLTYVTRLVLPLTGQVNAMAFRLAVKPRLHVIRLLEKKSMAPVVVLARTRQQKRAHQAVVQVRVRMEQHARAMAVRARLQAASFPMVMEKEV